MPLVTSVPVISVAKEEEKKKIKQILNYLWHTVPPILKKYFIFERIQSYERINGEKWVMRVAGKAGKLRPWKSDMRWLKTGFVLPAEVWMKNTSKDTVLKVWTFLGIPKVYAPSLTQICDVISTWFEKKPHLQSSKVTAGKDKTWSLFSSCKTHYFSLFFHEKLSLSEATKTQVRSKEIFFNSIFLLPVLLGGRRTKYYL